MEQFDVVVIGEGIAGLTAAGLLARAGKRVASFEAAAFGGLVLNINHLDPVPEGAATSGADYASTLLMENIDAGVTRIEEPVQSVTQSGAGFVVEGSSTSVTAPHVIVASGASLKTLDVPGEQEFEGRGISHCADCDGPMFQDGEVVVVGGGDSAMQEALSLTEYVATVHLLVRGAELLGQAHFIEALRGKANVRIAYHTEVTAIEGDKFVTGVATRSTNGGAAGHIACGGVFPFIGLNANAEFAGELAERDANGWLVTDTNLATRTPGLWAIGAVRAGGDGLLTGAVADAARVAAAILA